MTISYRWRRVMGDEEAELAIHQFSDTKVRTDTQADITQHGRFPDDKNMICLNQSPISE
jgi:hypothetical protein